MFPCSALAWPPDGSPHSPRPPYFHLSCLASVGIVLTWPIIMTCGAFRTIYRGIVSVGPVLLSTRTRLHLAKADLELQMLHSQPRLCGLKLKAPHSMPVMSVVVLGV